MGKQGRLNRLAVLIAVSFCVMANSCPEPDYLEPAGQWPDGSSEAVAATGDLVFVGARTNLVIHDASDPADPRVVGRVYFPRGNVQDIAVSGNHAYVAAVQAGLRIVDISTPSEPVDVGRIGNSANGVEVADEIAYVVSHDGLSVIDVGSPSEPARVGGLPISGPGVIAVAGDYAYIATDEHGGQEAGLQVVDISTPTSPVAVGFVALYDQANGLAVSGDYVFVAAGPRGLRVVDVSDPGDPVVIHAAQPPGRAQDVAVSGDFAYLVDGFSGLRIFDITTPTEPAEIGLLESGWSWRIAVSGDHAYVTAEDAWLRIIDVSTPSEPFEVTVVENSHVSASAVAVSGGWAGVAGGGSSSGTGLFVLDVDPPSSALDVGFAQTQNPANDLVISGGFAFMAIADDGLRIVDIREPMAPEETGYVALPTALAVKVSEGHAFVAAGELGLGIFDVTDPSAPLELGFVDTTGTAQDVAVLDGHAYVAASEAGLRVIDVSTPSAPAEIGSVEMPEANVVSVAVDRGFAYVVGGGAVWVVDVRTPSEPEVVGITEKSGDDGKIAVARYCAYVAAGETGLSVIDVSSPVAPEEVGTAGEEGWITDVEVSDGYVFATSLFFGLEVFEECPDSGDLPQHLSFIPVAALTAGAEGSFFETDIEINNTGEEMAVVQFVWHPTGDGILIPIFTHRYYVEPGVSLPVPNALQTLFGLEADVAGPISIVSDRPGIIGMSRTFNRPAGGEAGTFGQSLPAVPAGELIRTYDSRRIIFMSQDSETRANVGCINGTSDQITVTLDLFDSQGTPLETMDVMLSPWAHRQINRIFGDYAPVSGYVDVSTDTIGGLFYCYGSMLDNETSDPTTILPQDPSDRMVFIPAAAVAAGAEGAFFQTDVDLNNTGDFQINYAFKWLPRGQDNSSAEFSDQFSLGSGMGARLVNVLPEVFGLEPDATGALMIVAGSSDLLAMSRTYNIPSTKEAGTFGQALPGVHQNTMIATGEKKRIIFMRENDEFRSNVGCVNALDAEVIVNIELFDSDGNKLGTRYMRLPPMSNKQANGIFQDYAPVSGYVDVWTDEPDASIYCYGSVLDNVTSDPTTILPQ